MPTDKNVGKQACTCKGTCRGKLGLGEGWYCVLESGLEMVDKPKPSLTSPE